MFCTLNSCGKFELLIGLTQKELGKKVGVSRQAVNAIETGKHPAYEIL